MQTKYFCVVGVLLMVACSYPALALHSSVRYNLQDSATLLMYSYSAYCNASDILMWDCYWCTMLPISFEPTNRFYDQKTETFGYAGYTNDEIVVAFRGSSELENWLTNIKFEKTEPFDNMPDVGVHLGFYEAWKTVRQSVDTEVSGLKRRFPTHTVVVTGHSLGAALAMLCTAELAVKHPTWDFVNWNFGCPRVGNQGWVNYYTNITNIVTNYRVINQQDIVPQVPPEVMSYKHEPQEIWYAKDTDEWVECSETFGEDKSCENSLVANSIDDHLNYLGFNLEDGNDFAC